MLDFKKYFNLYIFYLIFIFMFDLLQGTSCKIKLNLNFIMKFQHKKANCEKVGIP